MIDLLETMSRQGLSVNMASTPVNSLERWINASNGVFEMPVSPYARLIAVLYQSNQMNTLEGHLDANGIAILALLILGAGFVAMFAGVSYFFVIWILGFAVLLPLVAILVGDEESERRVERVDSVSDDDSAMDDSLTDTTSDVLATLRDRYVRGDLSDEQFEQKLDWLLVTESPEAATEWRLSQHNRDPDYDRERERSREWERESA